MRASRAQQHACCLGTRARVSPWPVAFVRVRPAPRAHSRLDLDHGDEPALLLNASNFTLLPLRSRACAGRASHA